jgi:hypothetical protein
VLQLHTRALRGCAQAHHILQPAHTTHYTPAPRSRTQPTPTSIILHAVRSVVLQASAHLQVPGVGPLLAPGHVEVGVLPRQERVLAWHLHMYNVGTTGKTGPVPGGAQSVWQRHPGSKQRKRPCDEVAGAMWWSVRCDGPRTSQLRPHLGSRMRLMLGPYPCSPTRYGAFAVTLAKRTPPRFDNGQQEQGH